MPVRTISLVSGSCSRWIVRSSSVILWSAPESLASSPRFFGATARPTIGVGKVIGGSSTSPSDRAGVQVFALGDGDDLARAGVVDRVRVAPLHFEQRAELDPLARVGGVDGGVAFERAGEDAQEAEPLDERIDAGLEDLRRQRRRGVGLERHLVAVGIAATGDGRSAAARRWRADRAARRRRRPSSPRRRRSA